ncbi:hypothetical protein ACFY1B_32645 [Streptomyces mirabilis]|uniref:hypothetical protein n=1 Tax=Streptomyces mirabilis TaxID=68239 RepID=UPI003695EF4B
MRAVAGGLNSVAPIDALAVGLDAVSEMLTVQRDWLRVLDRGDEECAVSRSMRESLDELKAVSAGRQVC